jgi:hypothetical protein
VPGGGAVHSITSGLIHRSKEQSFIRSGVEAGSSLRTQFHQHPRDG